MHSAALLLGSGLLAAAMPQAPEKMRKGVYEISLRCTNDNDAYGMDLGIGTPPQTVTLLVDTGSNTYSAESPNDKYCQEGMCKKRALSNLGYGDVLRDDLTVGGNSFKHMEFGYIQGHDRDTRHQLAALAGLSLQCSDKYCNSTNSFTQAIYEAGHIKKRAYSLFLGPGDGSVPAQLVMGGIDRAKRQGPVYKYKLLKPWEDGGIGFIGQLLLSGISMRQPGEANVDFKYEGEDKVLWDSGSPRWYAPAPVFWNVTKYFGLPDTVDRFDGRLEVDCKYRKPNDDKLVVIMDGGDELPIPMWQLLNVRDDGKCYLDMMGIQGAYGDSFVRNVYLTYDYEEMALEVSRAKYTDIVAIE